MRERGGVFLAVEYVGIHVGCAGIKNIKDDIGEIWYYLGDELFRGHGLGTLVVCELVTFARNELELRGLCSRVLANNIASRKVLERNSFVLSKRDFGIYKGVQMLRYERDIS